MEGLLAAATSLIGEIGYEATTMSRIADRAGASIGSLYQFFPNKRAVARALCESCGRTADALWTQLQTRAAGMTIEQLVREYVAQMVQFVDDHPEFLSLADIPPSAVNPGMRQRLRERLAQVLLSHSPATRREKVIRIADVMLQINKGLMSRYAIAQTAERGWVVEEFEAVLACYLKSRLAK